MNGAQALIAGALRAGVDVCFANPGTTELPLVLALDDVAGMRAILCLHENVATGAADGYGRMAGKPAMCLLHLGPGLANGLTNLHNAKRAYTPVLNVIGQHASWHVSADPLLASNIECIAGVVGDCAITSSSASTIPADIAAAIAATRQGAGGISTLIVPHDFQIAEAGASSPVGPVEVAARTFTERRLVEAVKVLRAGHGALLLGGEALSEAGMRLAGRIASACGADLICDTFFARMERGGDLPRATRLPYFPDQALELTKRYQHVVIAGTRRPVGFFGYPGLPSHLTTAEQTVMLSEAHEDTLGALGALAEALKAPAECRVESDALPSLPKGGLDAHSVSATIARLQPQNAIIMDEALTVGVPYFAASQAAPRFSHLMLTGGAIGEGPGAATGAAVACPQRKVINWQSDGCGAYSVQALWTQARETLDVLTIIGSNRSYNILNVELQRAGVRAPGPVAQAMAALNRPYLDWVKIGEGFGVQSVAVDSVQSLAREIEKALAAKGPRLIEAIMN